MLWLILWVHGTILVWTQCAGVVLVPLVWGQRVFLNRTSWKIRICNLIPQINVLLTNTKGKETLSWTRRALIWDMKSLQAAEAMTSVCLHKRQIDCRVIYHQQRLCQQFQSCSALCELCSKCGFLQPWIRSRTGPRVAEFLNHIYVSHNEKLQRLCWFTCAQCEQRQGLCRTVLRINKRSGVGFPRPRLTQRQNIWKTKSRPASEAPGTLGVYLV